MCLCLKDYTRSVLIWSSLPDTEEGRYTVPETSVYRQKKLFKTRSALVSLIWLVFMHLKKKHYLKLFGLLNRQFLVFILICSWCVLLLPSRKVKWRCHRLKGWRGHEKMPHRAERRVRLKPVKDQRLRWEKIELSYALWLIILVSSN